MENNNKTLALIIGIVVVFIIGAVAFSFFKFMPTSLEKSKVVINDHTFSVEVAQTDEEKQKGLSDRATLAEDKGMLFVFDKEGFYPFWMKDMRIPIDIIYLKGNQVVTVFPNVAYPQSVDENLNPPSYVSTQPADKVLELPAGSANKYAITEGDTAQISL